MPYVNEDNEILTFCYLPSLL